MYGKWKVTLTYIFSGQYNDVDFVGSPCFTSARSTLSSPAGVNEALLFIPSM